MGQVCSQPGIHLIASSGREADLPLTAENHMLSRFQFRWAAINFGLKLTKSSGEDLDKSSRDLTGSR